MSNSLVEFCASTSALEPSVASQKFQNISSLLVNESDLIFFISYIPQFQKTVRKAAWKSCQKKIKENGNETHLIEEAFKDQKTEHLKKDFAYFISSFSDPKCLLGPETKRAALQIELCASLAVSKMCEYLIAELIYIR